MDFYSLFYLTKPDFRDIIYPTFDACAFRKSFVVIFRVLKGCTS